MLVTARGLSLLADKYEMASDRWVVIPLDGGECWRLAAADLVCT